VRRQPQVFVVDDNAAVRDALACLFESVGIKMVGYASAEEFLAAYDGTGPGCLVVDVRMPGMSGLELHDILRQRACPLSIIFLTAHGDVPMAVRAVRDGATDFLEKPAGLDVLVDRVREALAEASQGREAASERAAVAARLATLTPRQREVLNMLLAGHSNKSIAARLRVTQKAIEFHRASIRKKMRAANLAQLMRMVVAVDDPPPQTKPETRSTKSQANPKDQRPE
jgi:FixJ family two-component response regulator